MSSSGGGASSSDLPEYIKYTHHEWMRGGYNDGSSVKLPYTIYHLDSDKSVGAILNATLKNALKNPYALAEIVNPAEYINQMNTSAGLARQNAYNFSSDPVADYVVAGTSMYKDLMKDTFDRTLGGEITEILADAKTKASEIIATASIASKQRAMLTSKEADSTSKAIALNGIGDLVEAAINTTNLGLSTEVTGSIDTVITQAITRAKSSLSSLITEAISKAAEVVGSTVVTDLVDSFEARTNTRHLRGISRTSAQMAISGAANSSALIIGNVLLESERGIEVSDFEAKLKLEVFRDILGLYATKGDTTVSTFMSAYTQEYGLRLQEFQTKFTELMRYMLTLYAQHVQTVQAYVGSQFQYATSISAEHLSKYYTLYIQDIAQRNQAVLEVVRTKMDADYKKVVLGYDAERFLADISRIALIANREWRQDVLSNTIGYYTWDLQLFQQAGNIMGAASGNVVGKTEPSRTTALGGTLSGAVAGASVGSSIAPGYGSVVGAIAGGVLGYISSI